MPALPARRPSGCCRRHAGSRRWPVQASLDRAAPEHPVTLWSKDGHLLWVNSLAMERASLSAATPEPANGAILRD
ncbi:MAG TPA: amidohydrolase family protein, partial [Ktedonobacteraceae bacterium]|nr:amidohydrolase family protein [Ktedonobacteraceae bacterium]